MDHWEHTQRVRTQDFLRGSEGIQVLPYVSAVPRLCSSAGFLSEWRLAYGCKWQEIYFKLLDFLDVVRLLVDLKDTALKRNCWQHVLCPAIHCATDAPATRVLFGVLTTFLMFNCVNCRDIERPQGCWCCIGLALSSFSSSLTSAPQSKLADALCQIQLGMQISTRASPMSRAG